MFLSETVTRTFCRLGNRRRFNNAGYSDSASRCGQQEVDLGGAAQLCWSAPAAGAEGALPGGHMAPVPSLPPLGCQEAVPMAPKGCTPKLLAVPLSQLPAHAPQACAACQPRGHADGPPKIMHVCMLCIACVLTLRFACLCSFLLGRFQNTVMVSILLSNNYKSSASHLLRCYSYRTSCRRYGMLCRCWRL